MSRQDNISPDALELLERFCEGELDADEAERLERLVCSDPAVCRLYIKYVDLHVELSKRFRLDKPEQIPNYSDVNENILALSPLPSLPTTRYPLPTTFVGGPVFSYMVATVVLCLMLLGAWAYKISHIQPSDPGIANSNNPPSPVFVGQITGMKDCRWSDPDTQTVVGASVSLDRQYAIATGLLEITYKTGARVILEGPCTYRVESTAGGFLKRGKLTANIKGQKSEHSSLIPHPSYFVVKTPTAVVTDLGTEFGVEVAENGDTTSHVFQGSVKVETVGGTGSASGIQTTLSAGDSVFVKKDETNTPRFTHPTTPPKFIRRLYEPPKLLDLLDIVAGGNGLGNRRECGIDPATGKQDTWFLGSLREDDHDYHRVTWHPLIDGVFIPYVPTSLPPTPQGVQLDSTGNTFERFLEGRIIGEKKNYHCTLIGYTVGSIWARRADMQSAGATNVRGWIYSLFSDGQYMPKGRGLLGLHANVGITFDLAAMRKLHTGVRPARLRAMVGMGDGPKSYPDALHMADLWIFVDGRLKWVRKDIRPEDGAIRIDVPLGPNDRFLTIVSTNGQYGKNYDWMVLGDPVLQMSPTDPEDTTGE